PASFDAQYQLGRAFYYQRKASDAHQHFQAALQLNPDSAEAHIMMGNTMLRLRNAEAALKEYQEGVKLDPKGPMAEPAKQMIGKIQTALASQKK
ncbi:MAG: tetratricopeptide repeat protein, partial [Terriglobales bacterium]